MTSRSRTPRRALPSLVLLAGLLLGVTLLAVPTASTAAPATDRTERSGGKDRSTGTYRNPLAPEVPGTDRTVDSCADPAVVRGEGRTRGEWFMYCTTDPLDDSETADGDPVFHPLPMLRSTDLVDWTYVGDALPQLPDWAGAEAYAWAPDVVYSTKHRQWYLTYVVTDTSDETSGEPGCTSDSAIGVATSSSPTGPWTTSDEPLVGPRRAGPGCDFYWTYDPDVLGDRVGGRSTFYYGSYYGGVFAQDVRLRRDGMELTGRASKVTRGQEREPAVDPADLRGPTQQETAGQGTEEDTQVSIANRYEGTNVVRRGGWYYLFASATNCCAGPLTGYSVFAGRSRDPKGPFVDREGVSLLAGRVGGTPVLSMNGNRWVGTGHNSVFRDAGGRWWTAYHAIDRDDPYFEGQVGFTKRPVLLDPLDWVDGWPTVRAGRWASDARMPAPAAQRGEHSAYRPRPVAPLETGRRLPAYGDELDGTSPRGWTWVRPPAAGETRSTGTGLEWRTQDADLYVDSNTASVLTRPAPDGDYVVETKVRLDVPAEGCCQNYVQAGLVLYGSDDSFVKLAHASIFETRQTEWGTEVPTAPEGWPRYGNSVVGPPGEWTWLRIVREERAGADHLTALTSTDGRRWVRGGTWANDLPDDARIGLVSMGGSGFTATFDHVRTWRLR